MNNPDKPSLADEFERLCESYELDEYAPELEAKIGSLAFRNRAHILAALREYEAKHA